MPNVLIGLASSHEALIAAPVARELHTRGVPTRVTLCGDAAAADHAAALGLSGAPVLTSGTNAAMSIDAVGAFAATSLQDADVVLLFGHGPFVVALASAAQLEGRRSALVHAGERSADGRDRARRGAECAVDQCFVRSDLQREQLLREGRSADDARVIGSLAEQCFDHLPPAGAGKPAIAAVALSQSDPEVLGQSVRAALEQVGAAIEVAPVGAGASAELERLRRAAVIVTDDLLYQELAATNGIAAVVPAPAAARPDLLHRGAALLVEHPSALADGLHAALAADAAQPTDPLDDAACALVDALLPAPDEAEPEASTALALPTEANHTGRTFDDSECNAIQAVLRSGTLNSTRGTAVHRFEREFAEWLGVKHAIACANGSAAVHCAVAALKLEAGDEVITTPITDMGALTPICYEGAVPVFADVDADTLNVTAETIEAQLTDRTRAIIATHLFGRPCVMDPILALAERHGLPIIEDAAQAFGATLGDSAAGTFGDLAAFSLQQGKHITTGEGGIVCTDDDELARQVFLYVNKAFGYGDERPDHYFPALNYRMTELQGAVACAQLPKLDEVVSRRRMVAEDLRARLSDLPGIRCPSDPDDGMHAYWKWSFLVDEQVVCGGAVELGARMRALGVACAPRYVQKPAFECQVFTNWRDHPVSRLPLSHNPRGATEGPLFRREDYPGAVRGLEQVVVLPINERYRPHHVVQVADAIREAHEELTRG